MNLTRAQCCAKCAAAGPGECEVWSFGDRHGTGPPAERATCVAACLLLRLLPLLPAAAACLQLLLLLLLPLLPAAALPTTAGCWQLLAAADGCCQVLAGDERTRHGAQQHPRLGLQAATAAGRCAGSRRP
jgi:hypothetical protein